MTFVLATANPGKVNEMREILNGEGIDIVSRYELGIDIDIPETGSSFMDNAILKARAICGAAGLPAIADDSGLMVDSLDGAPGVYSSTFGGEALSDAERCEHLIGAMKDMEQRRAKFVCTIVCIFPDGSTLSAQGECHGEIADVPRGAGGFGYDPLFVVDGLNKTMAELSVKEKNSISHRGSALREFSSMLAQFMAMRRGTFL